MKQRQSLINLPQPNSELSFYGYFTADLFVSKYLLCSGNANTPMMFLDRAGLNSTIKDAYDYGQKLNQCTNITEITNSLHLFEDLHEEVVSDTDLSTIASDFTCKIMFQSTALVMLFPESETIICCVGAENNYYFIDLKENIFYSTMSPEYDILSFQERFQRESSICLYYTLRNVEPVKFEKKEEDAKPKPTKKRTKKTTEDTDDSNKKSKN